MKFFASCVIPRVRQVGIIQVEADSEDLAKPIVESLAPCRCEFRMHEVEEFDSEIPVGVFVNADEAKKLGY